MDDEKLNALQGSIAKWEAIVAGTGEDHGWKNCPLCVMFNQPDSDHDCSGCPVADSVGEHGCEETPYIEWAEAFAGREPKIATTPERKALAQAELDFLRSLVPSLTSPVETPNG